MAPKLISQHLPESGELVASVQCVECQTPRCLGAPPSMLCQAKSQSMLQISEKFMFGVATITKLSKFWCNTSSEFRRGASAGHLHWHCSIRCELVTTC